MVSPGCGRACSFSSVVVETIRVQSALDTTGTSRWVLLIGSEG